MPPKKINTLFDGGDKSGGGNKGNKKTDNKKPGKWSNVQRAKMNLNRHTLGGTLEQQDGNTTHSLSGNFASKLSEVVGVQGHVNHQFESGLAVGGGANVSIGVDAKKGAPKVEFGAGGGASYNFGGDSQLTVRGGGGIEASTSSGFGGKFSAGVSGNVDDNHNVGLSVGTDSFGLSVTKKVTKEFYTEEGFGLKKD